MKAHNIAALYQSGKSYKVGWWAGVGRAGHAVARWGGVCCPPGRRRHSLGTCPACGLRPALLQAWKKNFMNKKIKVRNPITCQVITVTSYDTCDGAACPDPSGVGPGCCTAHADMNGGTLVDLEYFTSVRFWGAPIGVDEVRRLEWQFA